ncbi:putative transmembrane protein [Gottschalkia acidurici 9a]|uniref:Transmembrane protein n=1 Tax=Gottschalkia acidurici (strain ATCC 7906 / DSM 604 / BCRC 14475 / CIP 104303 / KCTC 5404 / NCIMB 10678 / 9a) TaxID=1128398 RepID=K0B0D9_GOTA9|nr:exopolysaccharide Pel transporter PelG [Gottschalkia acidurici]AFS79503.1 putative transmembrane protein [Gottschalkia acidurici 9a]
MAGIGFTLKRLFRDETYTNRGKAYIYSALVSAGPWIAAVVTVNIMLATMEVFLDNPLEKELFMGTIVYSFVFSQIITAPWQFIITRYISDKLYTEEYDCIRPSYIGINKIVFFLSFIIAVCFYINKPISIYYKVMSIYLFTILTMVWILMVYLSAVKNYELISKAYIYGGLISIGMTIFFLLNPIKFPSNVYSTNILFAYLLGISLTFAILLYSFLSTFYFGNNLEYDFIRYVNKFPSLFYIGLFYTVGLWIDDIIMWFSVVGVNAYETYHYAPIYDNAVFLAYLTTIPSTVMFLVSVETEFYDCYKKYYELANKTGTYEELLIAKNEMKKTLYGKLRHTFYVQLLITTTIILLSRQILSFLNISIVIRNIFRISALGAVFNIFALLIIIVLLYFESRVYAVIVSFIFLASNIIFTYLFSSSGLEYYGYGFTIGSFISLIIAMIFLSRFIKKLNFTTFSLQPLFVEEDTGIFIKISDTMNRYKLNEVNQGNNLLKNKLKINSKYINILIILAAIFIYFIAKIISIKF